MSPRVHKGRSRLRFVVLETCFSLAQRFALLGLLRLVQVLKHLFFQFLFSPFLFSFEFFLLLLLSFLLVLECFEEGAVAVAVVLFHNFPFLPFFFLFLLLCGVSGLTLGWVLGLRTAERRFTPLGPLFLHCFGVVILLIKLLLLGSAGLFFLVLLGLFQNLIFQFFLAPQHFLSGLLDPALLVLAFFLHLFELVQIKLFVVLLGPLVIIVAVVFARVHPQTVLLLVRGGAGLAVQRRQLLLQVVPLRRIQRLNLRQVLLLINHFLLRLSKVDNALGGTLPSKANDDGAVNVWLRAVLRLL